MMDRDAFQCKKAKLSLGFFDRLSCRRFGGSCRMAIYSFVILPKEEVCSLYSVTKNEVAMRN
jgi:hypothetical protein